MIDDGGELARFSNIEELQALMYERARTGNPEANQNESSLPSANPSEQSPIAPDPTRPYDFISVRDILAGVAEDEPPAIVSGLISSGAFVIVASKPKVGKTTLLLDLAKSVALGVNFLGFPTKQGTVLYAALEGPKAIWEHQLRSMRMDECDNLKLYIGRAPQDATKWLHGMARLYKPSLIIVDTLQRYARVNSLNDYSEVSSATEALIAISQDFGATVVTAHHTNKSDRGDAGDNLLGSTALFGSVDTLITLKDRGGHRTIETDQRFFDNLSETSIIIDPLTRNLSLGQLQSEMSTADVVIDILSFVPRGAWVSHDELLKKTGARREASLISLRNALDKKALIRCGTGHKGDPFMYALADVDRIEATPDSVPAIPPPIAERGMAYADASPALLSTGAARVLPDDAGDGPCVEVIV